MQKAVQKEWYVGDRVEAKRWDDKSEDMADFFKGAFSGSVMMLSRYDFHKQMDQLTDRRIHEKTSETRRFLVKYALLKLPSNFCRLSFSSVVRGCDNYRTFENSVFRRFR